MQNKFFPVLCLLISISILVMGCDQTTTPEGKKVVFVSGVPVPGTQEFTKQTGIPITYAPVDFNTQEHSFKAIQESDAKLAAPKVIEALNLLPRDLLQKSRINVILAISAGYAAGVTFGAVHGAKTGTANIVLNVSLSNLHSPEEVYHTRAVPRSTVLHEFMHALDFTQNGQAEFQNWNSLNPADFQYSGYGKKTVKLLEQYPQSFVSEYSTTNEFEDRAEIFEYLSNRDRAQIISTARSKKKIVKKFRSIQNFLAGISPQMDSFWVANFNSNAWASNENWGMGLVSSKLFSGAVAKEADVTEGKPLHQAIVISNSKESGLVLDLGKPLCSGAGMEQSVNSLD
jgi:hypothetical protein